jgi:uncharacterized protein
MRTMIEHYTSVLEIPFQTWQQQGITCVLLDVDSTITPWLETTVGKEIAEKLSQTRMQGITHIALVTNSNKRNVPRIADIAAQIGADAYFMPQRFRERKPRPSLIQQAMETFNLPSEQIAMVGDKYGTDVLAAKRAGIARVAWVDRLGDADHPYDRYLRRPVEKLIKRAQARVKTQL